MSDIVFFLEERSAKELLQVLLPRAFPGNAAQFKYKVYEGKSDLQKNIAKELKHYRTPEARFIVLHDQDASDCHALKASLAELCRTTGKVVTIRIACRELESWYLAQLDAVEKAFEVSGLADQQNRKKFRNPDLLGTPDHLLRQLTNNRYQKISGSRILGNFLNPECERSASFKYFIQAVKASLQ